MWAVIIYIFAYHEKVDWMYFLASAAVAIGLLIYLGGDKEEDRCADVTDKDAKRSKLFDEEVGSAGSHNRGTIVERNLKAGDASISTVEREAVDNKSIEKEMDRVV